MEPDTTANDNRYLEYGVLDPDRYYVRDYLNKALDHFEECKINRATVFWLTGKAMIDRLLPGNPKLSLSDESALLSDLTELWPFQDKINDLVEQYEAALASAQRARTGRHRLAFIAKVTAALVSAARFPRRRLGL